MIKVFYDGNCPVCSKEIKLYKSLNNNNSIKWYNIFNDKDALKIINKSKEECLKSFHVMEGNKVYKETNAFFVLWKNIRYFKLIYYLFNFRLIKDFLNIFYKIYANYRFKKLYKNKGANAK